MQLGKIPPLHFISVGMTCRWVVPFNRTGCIRYVVMAMNHRRYIGWFHSSQRVIFGTLLERHTGRSLRFRWRVLSFNRTGYIRNVAGGRLPPLRTRRWVMLFIPTGCVRNAAGTAHRPFPTVSLICLFFYRRVPRTSAFFRLWHVLYTVTGVFKQTTSVAPITVNCPLSTLSIVNYQLSIVNSEKTVNCQLKLPRRFQKTPPAPGFEPLRGVYTLSQRPRMVLANRK